MGSARYPGTFFLHSPFQQHNSPTRCMRLSKLWCPFGSPKYEVPHYTKDQNKGTIIVTTTHLPQQRTPRSEAASADISILQPTHHCTSYFGYTVDSNKLEYGPGTINAGVPSSAKL